MSLGSATFDVKADVSDMTAGFARMRGEIDQLIVQERKLEASQDQLAHSGASVQGSSRQMAYAFMQLGHAVDDIQYGFSAVVNNITPIVYGLTGSMGLAGAAQIAAVAGYQLYEHWQELQAAFGDTAPYQVAYGGLLQIGEALGIVSKDTEEAQSQILDLLASLSGIGALLPKGRPGMPNIWTDLMDRVGRALGGKGVDMDQLGQAKQLSEKEKRRAKVPQELAKFQTEQQKEFAQDFAKALGQYKGGPTQLIQDLINERMARAGAAAAGPQGKKLRAELEKEIPTAVADALQGKGKAEDFGLPMARRIRGLQEERENKRDREGAKAGDDMVKRFKAMNKLSEDLTKEGMHNQELMEKEQEKERKEDERAAEKKERELEKWLRKDIEAPRRLKEHERPQWMGLVEFAKMSVDPANMQRKQLEELNRIRQLLAEDRDLRKKFDPAFVRGLAQMGRQGAMGQAAVAIPPD